ASVDGIQKNRRCVESGCAFELWGDQVVLLGNFRRKLENSPLTSSRSVDLGYGSRKIGAPLH
ncbi:MAG: hypothetical protein ACE1ZV_00360, partial [Alphaproteobacteria bacterium]